MSQRKLISSATLRKQAQELLAKGEMPSLEEVLDAVAEVRAKYQPQILAARKESPKQESED